MATESDEFFTGDSGASRTYPVQCSALRKGSFVIIKGRPCKVADMSTSKTGKHGHAKIHIVGIDIFTQKKCEDICPSTHNVDVPNVIRKEYELVDIDKDGRVTLMSDSGVTRDDLNLPDGDLGKCIREKFEREDDFIVMVTVQSAMDEEHIVSQKSQAK